MKNKIEYVLKKHNIKQKDLAKILKVTPSTISEWKSGRLKPSLEDISNISNYYQISTDYLLGLTDSPDEKKPTPIEVDLETFAAALKEKGLKASDFEKLSKEQWAVIADIIKNFKQ